VNAAACVLRHGQAVQRRLGDRVCGAEEDRGAERSEGFVYGDGAASGERHAERAWRALVIRQLAKWAEIHVAGVLLHDALGLIRMRREPGGNALVADVVSRDVAVGDQDSADGGVGLAVLAIEPDAQGVAVGQDDAARPLDLQHERIHWAGDVGRDWRLAVEGAAINGGARQCREVGVRRFGVERHFVAGGQILRAGNFRLEIAGDEHLAVDGVGGEIGLEESAGGGVVAGRDGLRGGTAVLPEARLPCLQLREAAAAERGVRRHEGEGFAAEDEGGEGGGGVVGIPARKGGDVRFRAGWGCRACESAVFSRDAAGQGEGTEEVKPAHDQPLRAAASRQVRSGPFRSRSKVQRSTSSVTASVPLSGLPAASNVRFT